MLKISTALGWLLVDSKPIALTSPLSWVSWLTSFQAAFGLASVPELITVSGRMLGPPKLTYDEP